MRNVLPRHLIIAATFVVAFLIVWFAYRIGNPDWQGWYMAPDYLGVGMPVYRHPPLWWYLGAGGGVSAVVVLVILAMVKDIKGQ